MSGKSSASSSRRKTSLRLRYYFGVRDKYNWTMLWLLPATVAGAYAASNLIVIALLAVLKLLNMPISSFMRPSLVEAAVATVIYILTILMVIAVPYLVHGKFSTNLKTLGLDRLVTWTDIGLAPVVFIVYMVSVSVWVAFITALFPGFPADQVQDVGFRTYGTSVDSMLAFVTLVVFAPLAEETLFRGYLYGKLKKYAPAVVAALITSLLFAIAHFQWNVGVDVFVLSLFLCWLRSITGSIWAGVLVHMIKNGIAYFILFVYPFVGG